MHERKDFWDKNAGRYDRFMRNDRAAYEKMYGLIRPVVKEKGSVRPKLTYSIFPIWDDNARGQFEFAPGH